MQPAPVAEDVDPAVALLVAERPEDYPGVTAEGQAVRAYPAPEGIGAAHLLGYLSPVTADELAANDDLGGAVALAGTDLVGRSGLEQVYDTDLRGTPGTRTVQVDARGAVVAEVGRTAPGRRRTTSVTSIDAGLQAVTERALADAIARARTLTDPDGHAYLADGGAAVVLDVTDGSVVALASAPVVRPGALGRRHRLVGLRTPSRPRTPACRCCPVRSRARTPRRRRSRRSPPPPRSSRASAPARTRARASWRSATGSSATTSRGRTARSRWPERSRSPATPCSTGSAYDLWLRDGGTCPIAAPADAVTTMARGFGLGRPTGIDLPGEAAGQVADRSWKQENWEATREESCAGSSTGYPEVAATDPARAAYLLALARENCEDGWRLRAGDAVNTAIGQGETLVTPLQMAVAYGAIANGGTLWQPRVGQQVVDQAGEVVREIPAAEAGRLPVSAVDPGLPPYGAAGRPTVGHGCDGVRGLPARPDPDRGEDRLRRGVRQAVDVVVRGVQRPVRRGHDREPGRHRECDQRSRGPSDLRRAVRGAP